MIRKFNAGMAVVWIVVGLPVSWYLKNSVAWVVFMSVYAIIIGHVSAWRSDVPNATE